MLLWVLLGLALASGVIGMSIVWWEVLFSGGRQENNESRRTASVMLGISMAIMFLVAAV